MHIRSHADYSFVGMETGGDVERMELAQRLTVAKALKVRTACVYARVYILVFL
jgi:hypothetical protein